MRGIGYATAICFAQEGAEVAVIGRARDPKDFLHKEQRAGWKGLESVVEEIEACGTKGLAITADVRDRRQVESVVDKAVAELGRIDYLVANAGVLLKVPFLELTDEAWLRVIDTNLNGVFCCSQAVLKHMMERGSGGAIVNASSRAGKMEIAEVSAYGAAKFGVNGLTQVLALEFGPHKIRVNSVCPGPVKTNMIGADDVWKKSQETGLDIASGAQIVHEDAVAHAAVKRPAGAEEIAACTSGVQTVSRPTTPLYDRSLPSPVSFGVHE